MNLPESMRVPSNFEEAKQKFEEIYADSPNGKQIAQCMTGILYCRLKQGEEFYKAYENTLRYYIEIGDKKK